MAATMEAYHGIYLIFELIMPSRNLMQLYIYWQYLRLRYMVDSTGTYVLLSLYFPLFPLFCADSQVVHERDCFFLQLLYFNLTRTCTIFGLFPQVTWSLLLLAWTNAFKLSLPSGNAVCTHFIRSSIRFLCEQVQSLEIAVLFSLFLTFLCVKLTLLYLCFCVIEWCLMQLERVTRCCRLISPSK